MYHLEDNTYSYILSRSSAGIVMNVGFGCTERMDESARSAAIDAKIGSEGAACVVGILASVDSDEPCASA